MADNDLKAEIARRLRKAYTEYNALPWQQRNGQRVEDYVAKKLVKAYRKGKLDRFL